MAEMRIDISEIVNRAVDKLIESGWRPSEWIPCRERLPEKDVSVLIYAAGHRVTAYFDAVKGVFRLTETDGLFYLQSAVTHWMPLPEPPKDGDVP